MIICKVLNIYGFMEAVHGMRNPMNSWDRMDSQMYKDSEWEEEATFLPGDNDLTLMKNLFKAGTEHRKYLRMMNYEVVARIIEQRKNHKLDEWNDFIDVLSSLPLIDDLLVE